MSNVIEEFSNACAVVAPRSDDGLPLTRGTLCFTPPKRVVRYERLAITAHQAISPNLASLYCP
jgi:hypothetical protein